MLLYILSLGVVARAADVPVTISNNTFVVQMDARKGHVLEIRQNNKRIVSNPDTENPLWEISLNDTSGAVVKLNAAEMEKFSYRKSGNSMVELEWKGSGYAGLGNVMVTATVQVVKSDSVSLWGLKIEGLTAHSIEEVVYPVIGGIVNSPESKMAIPSWMGHLYPDPSRELSNRTTKMARWVYPGMFSMQFLTIYDVAQSGFYSASNDSQAFQKEFRIRLNEKKQLVSDQVHFPEYKAVTGSYEMPYQAVIGGFKGDWFTAAEMYRNWGTRQEWAKNSRLKNAHIADWLGNTSLWIWNRGRAEEVLRPARDIQQQLGSPVSVLWHWWHNSSYDDTFPDYIPPRDGKSVFIKAVKEARDHDINAIVYMNQMQWARSTPSWTSENAERFAAKNKDGSTTDHVYNIFSGKSLTNMCIATDFWRNKYTSLADTVLNKYAVSGIYMDQACLSRMCFDPAHGHHTGGGNYWMKSSAKLTEQIRQRASPEIRKNITLSGEGVSESWLPYLDAFLALQVSMERYAGIGAVPIPLFQAVYHPYGVVYGNYSSLLKPPYDEKWPAEQKPSDALELLDAKYNMQFKMEQGRSFVWGMQPMLSNYLPLLEQERKEEMAYLYQLVRVRNNALKYLMHGVMMPDITLNVPKENLSISKLSIYAGQKEKVTNFEKEYPTLYSTVWKSADNSLGIAVSNIAEQDYNAEISLHLNSYGIKAKNGKVNLIDESGKKVLADFKNGQIVHTVRIPANTSYVIEIEPAR